MRAIVETVKAYLSHMGLLPQRSPVRVSARYTRLPRRLRRNGW